MLPCSPPLPSFLSSILPFSLLSSSPPLPRLSSPLFPSPHPNPFPPIPFPVREGKGRTILQRWGLAGGRTDTHARSAGLKASIYISSYRLSVCLYVCMSTNSSFISWPIFFKPVPKFSKFFRPAQFYFGFLILPPQGAPLIDFPDFFRKFYPTHFPMLQINFFSFTKM